MLLNEFKENNSKNSNKSDLLQDGNPEIPITQNSSFHEKQFVRMTCLLTF